jgi:hypothetical protein
MMKEMNSKDLETFLQSKSPSPKTGAAAVIVAGGVVGSASGYTFGGPIGAAVGAGIGFAAPAATYMYMRIRYGRN